MIWTQSYYLRTRRRHPSLMFTSMSDFVCAMSMNHFYFRICLHFYFYLFIDFWGFGRHAVRHTHLLNLTESERGETEFLSMKVKVISFFS